MADEGVSSIRIEGIGLFSLSVTNYLSVTNDKKETFYPYLQEAGHGGLLKLDVNSRTLTAFLKQHLDELVKEREANGLDSVEAMESALKFLNERGASCFTKRGISLRRK